jgi:methyltransferase (TIGR00027 family)
MKPTRPSTTARRVAMRRAAHQLFDSPRVLDDPLACRILGEDALAIVAADRAALEGPGAASLRAFLVARSRYAEDAARAAFARGVAQVVVLGAGFDTFGARNREAALRVFEVDHPATQASKREALAGAGIDVPRTLVFAPIDFERQMLGEALENVGFDAAAPAFFHWLGVTPYLSGEAIRRTLAYVASRPGGSEIVFDFAVSPAVLGPEERRLFDLLAARVASVGEPWVTFFDAAALASDLAAMGFASAEVVAPDAINARYFQSRADGLRVGKIGHLIQARAAAAAPPAPG